MACALFGMDGVYIVVVDERYILYRRHGRVRVVVVEGGVGENYFICRELIACKYKYVTRDMTLETARAPVGMDGCVCCDDCRALGRAIVTRVLMQSRWWEWRSSWWMVSVNDCVSVSSLYGI